ncbi:MAG: PAS domain S-box protein [Methanomicrobiales archaeon]
MSAVLRVLYVDDEPGLLDIGKLFLEAKGEFIITTLSSARAALELLNAERFDAIISDYQMPEMDGIQFLDEVRANFGWIPFILFTGRGREEVVIQAINRGADFYIQKGGEPRSQFAELAHTIRQAISRKNAEDSLRNREEEYRFLVEHSNEAIIVAQDGMVRLFNHRIVEITGYSDQELQSMPISLLIHPDDRAPVVERYQKRMNGEDTPSQYKFRMTGKEGQTIWVEISVMNIAWEGRPATINFLIDITSRMLALKALRESEERFQSYISNAPDGIFIADETGRYIETNPAASRITGYEKEELLAMRIADLLPPESLEAGVRSFRDVVETGHSMYELAFRHKDGSDRYWSVEAVRLPNATLMGFVKDITERKQAEDELLLTKARLDSAMEVGKIAWWEMDCVNGAVFFNERKARMLDYPAEQFSHYSDFTRLVHPDDYEPMMQGMRDHLTGIKKMYDVTYRIRKRNGNYLWTQDIGGVSEFAPDGTPLKVTGFVIDVTARKQVEEVLKESEQRFHSMFDRHNSIMLLVDPETGNIADANQAAEQFYGRSKTELCAQSITEINTLSPGEIAAEMNTAARENNNFFIFPHRIASGEIRTVEVHSSPIEVGGKTVLFSIINDITGRKQVEKQINDDYKFLQTLIQTIPNPVFFKDRNGLYTGCNKAFETFLGSSSSELIGKTVYETAPKDVADEYFRMDEELFNNPGTQQYESRIIMKSGQIRHVIFDKATILDINGEVTGIIGVVSDITSRKEAEMLISLMNKKLALLSGITRHDIGNQLSVILGYLDMLKSKLHDPALNEYFKTISRSAKQISRMIQFAKDYELIGVHAPTWQDCRTLVESAAKESALGNVEVKNNIPAGVEVFADPLISKVFYNLVDNAVRYGGKITTIQFLIEESGGDNVIICEDDGEGIPAGEKEMIFMQGYGKHTGIGLAFSRDILSITGTTICETGEPGKGARFEMAVPMGMFR